jgi:hypothetical protein
MRGKIVSGLGQGQYFLTREGYSRQFVLKLGFLPFPGTLNVILEEPFPAGQRAIKIEGFAEEGKSFGECKCYRIKINGIEAAVVRPESSGRMARARLRAKKRHLPMVAGSRLALRCHCGLGCDGDRGGGPRGGSGGHPGRADARVGKRRPTRFFIGNTAACNLVVVTGITIKSMRCHTDIILREQGTKKVHVFLAKECRWTSPRARRPGCLTRSGSPWSRR